MSPLETARRAVWCGLRVAVLLGLLAMQPGLAVAPARAALPAQPDPELEARVDRSLRAVGEHLYGGRLDLAQEAMATAAGLAPGDPRIGLFRFRLARVHYPDDIHESERAEALMDALLAPLDDTIAACDSMLVFDPDSAAAFLYRGWAHMMRAQTYAIAGKYWPAGSESRKGKKDFDRFLERHPAGDPDADAILGGYLYFADILPGVVKFLKWIIRVPGGDKDRGLAMLQSAAASDGYSRNDASLVLGVIYYLFEGRVVEASEIFESMGRAYPWQPRVVELRASTSLLYPESTWDSIALESAVIDAWGDRVRGWDELFLHRLRWSRARLLHQAGDYDGARADLQWIADREPPHPYWITPRAKIGLVGLDRNLGRDDAARRYCHALLEDPALEAFREMSEATCERQPDSLKVAIFVALGPAREALYRGELEEARHRLDRIIIQHGTDTRLRFFEGELERLSGRFAEADLAYRQVVLQAEGDGLESLRMVALLRLGEMHIERRQFEDAEQAYEEAQKMEPGASMLGNMIRGRLRFIEEHRD
ncbi:MAG: hypothetical protein PVF43_10555 [Candidatus Eiseniibacteriota bacterium]